MFDRFVGGKGISSTICYETVGCSCLFEDAWEHYLHVLDGLVECTLDCSLGFVVYAGGLVG